MAWKFPPVLVSELLEGQLQALIFPPSVLILVEN